MLRKGRFDEILFVIRGLMGNHGEGWVLGSGKDVVRRPKTGPLPVLAQRFNSPDEGVTARFVGVIGKTSGAKVTIEHPEEDLILGEGWVSVSQAGRRRFQKLSQRGALLGDEVERLGWRATSYCGGKFGDG
jgi:hypothetical protein